MTRSLPFASLSRGVLARFSEQLSLLGSYIEADDLLERAQANVKLRSVSRTRPTHVSMRTGIEISLATLPGPRIYNAVTEVREDARSRVKSGASRGVLAEKSVTVWRRAISQQS